MLDLIIGKGCVKFDFNLMFILFAMWILLGIITSDSNIKSFNEGEQKCLRRRFCFWYISFIRKRVRPSLIFGCKIFY